MRSESPRFQSLLQSVLLCVWFAAVAAAFWMPYLSSNLPIGLFNAVYAVFLLVSFATLALRLLRQGTDSSPKEDAPRRGL